MISKPRSARWKTCSPSSEKHRSKKGRFPALVGNRPLAVHKVAPIKSLRPPADAEYPGSATNTYSSKGHLPWFANFILDRERRRVRREW